MRISYSSLETFRQCPQKYKFQEIDKRKAPKSKEALFGTAVHGALQKMFSRDPLFPTLDEVLEHFGDTFDAKNTIVAGDKKRFADIGKKMLRRFYEKNPPWNFDVVDLESRFEVVLVDKHYEKTHVLVGKIDRIDKISDGAYEIIDYKTNRRLPSQDDVDKNTQLAVYHLGLKKRWPHLNTENVKLSLYFLRAQEKLSTTKSEEALSHAEAKIISDIHDIEAHIDQDSFPPKPSALCDWCGYKSICPAWKHLYQEMPKPEIDLAVKEFLELKLEIDERKKRLAILSSAIHEHMNSEGADRLFGTEGSVSRSKQERSTWDPDKVFEIIGTDPVWAQLVSLDPKKLNARLASLPYSTQQKLKDDARLIKTFVALKTSKKKEKK
jgi:putative RecB family exonuclease